MKIDAAERGLLELSGRLELPYVSRGDPDDVAMALGHRSRTFYRAHALCWHSAAFIASRVFLRPMVEINITLRYIRENPELRTKLWHHEAARQDVRWVRLLREHSLAPDNDRLPRPPQIDEMARDIENVRAEGLTAADEGVTKKGPLIPSVRGMVEILDDSQAWQAYTMGYTPLNRELHVSQAALRNAGVERLGGGWCIHHEVDEPSLGSRVLASSVFASTLVIVSGWLGLGIEDPADRVRERLVTMPATSWG